MFMFRSLAPILDEKTLVSLYYASFYSRVKYGIAFWGSSSDLIKVFILQKRLVRIITHRHFRCSCRKVFRDLNLLTVPSLYIYEVLMMVKKNLHEYPVRADIHCYDTRSRNKLCIPSHRTKIFEKCPTYVGKKLYNRLPVTIKNIHDNSLFSTAIKKMLIRRTYYSIEEYLADDQI